MDRSTTGTTNYGGTAILIGRKFYHNYFQNPAKFTEDTVAYTIFNRKELRLGTMYKRPNITFIASDLYKLLNTIIAGDLNTKNSYWHSYSPTQKAESYNNIWMNTSILSYLQAPRHNSLILTAISQTS